MSFIFCKFRFDSIGPLFSSGQCDRMCVYMFNVRNIQNTRICLGKKPIVSAQRKRNDFNKKQLTLLKVSVTSLLCGPRADLRPFYGFLCNRGVIWVKNCRSKKGLKQCLGGLKCSQNTKKNKKTLKVSFKAMFNVHFANCYMNN